MGVGNNASEAVAIATGATFECRARNRIFLHGQPLDAQVYALIPSEGIFNGRHPAADMVMISPELNHSK